MPWGVFGDSSPAVSSYPPNSEGLFELFFALSLNFLNTVEILDYCGFFVFLSLVNTGVLVVKFLCFNYLGAWILFLKLLLSISENLLSC